MVNRVIDTFPLIHKMRIKGVPKKISQEQREREEERERVEQDQDPEIEALLEKISEKRKRDRQNKAKKKRKKDNKIKDLLSEEKPQVSKAAMKRLVNEIAQDVANECRECEENENENENDQAHPMRFKKEAYDALHLSAEAYMVDVMQTSGTLSTFRGKTNIVPNDVRVASRMVLQGAGPLLFEDEGEKKE